jgi:hypothetical protein
MSGVFLLTWLLNETEIDRIAQELTLAGLA